MTPRYTIRIVCRVIKNMVLRGFEWHDRIASGQVFEGSLRCPKGRFVILRLPGEAEAGPAEVQLTEE